MKDFRYIDGASTLRLDPDRCIGCTSCTTVCPHQVLAMADEKAIIVDHDACIECGACATNCPTQALSVTPGVGCASYIIQVWLKGKDRAACGPNCC
ncbi:MAG: mercury methylation ferredoxin HgcB [Desulfovibrionaceae bacterium]